jgi:hypothetical protein
VNNLGNNQYSLNCCSGSSCDAGTCASYNLQQYACYTGSVYTAGYQLDEYCATSGRGVEPPRA